MIKQEVESYLKILEEKGDWIDYFHGFLQEYIRLNPEGANEICEEIIRISKERDYELGIAWGTAFLSCYYFYKCEYGKVLELCGKSFEYFEQEKDIKGMVFCCNILGISYMNLGFLQTAIEWCMKGLEVGKNLQYAEINRMLLLNVASCYFYLGLYDLANSFILEAKHLPYFIKPIYAACLLQLQAEIALAQDDIAWAETYSQEAIDIARRENFVTMLPDFLVTLGKVRLYQGDKQQSKGYFQEAFELCEQKDIHIIILMGYSDYFCETNQFHLAIEKLEEALCMTEEIHSMLYRGQVLKKLSEVHKRNQNYEQAYYYLEQLYTYQIGEETKQMSLLSSKSKWIKLEKENEFYRSMHQRANLISEMGHRITAMLNHREMVNCLYRNLEKYMPISMMGIAFYNKEKQVLEYSSFSEDGQSVYTGEIEIYDETCLESYCIQNNKEILLLNEHDLAKYKRMDDNQLPIRSCMMTPLPIGESVIGLLTIQSTKEQAYSFHDLETLKTLSSYVAVAIENAKLFQQVTHAANHDALTGCYNRQMVMTKAQVIFDRAMRYEESFSILLFDVDYFKKINDRYGHLVGDNILKEIVIKINDQRRTGDYFGRFGGEEFILILSNVTKEESIKVGERIRKLIEECSFQTEDGEEFNVTISLGIYTYDKDISDLYEGIKYADEALYKAKRAGRNCSVLYEK